uniref:Uncharacterized protein n=1 Tax=Ficedula albicollis TaxID=59894 RepID=A0A803V8X0_FICAL
HDQRSGRHTTIMAVEFDGAPWAVGDRSGGGLGPCRGVVTHVTVMSLGSHPQSCGQLEQRLHGVKGNKMGIYCKAFKSHILAVPMPQCGPCPA